MRSALQTSLSALDGIAVLLDGRCHNVAVMHLSSVKSLVCEVVAPNGIGVRLTPDVIWDHDEERTVVMPRTLNRRSPARSLLLFGRTPRKRGRGIGPLFLMRPARYLGMCVVTPSQSWAWT